MNNVDFEENNSMEFANMRKSPPDSYNNSFFVRLMIKLHFARNRSQALATMVLLIFLCFAITAVIIFTLVGVWKKQPSVIEKYGNIDQTQFFKNSAQIR